MVDLLDVTVARVHEVSLVLGIGQVTFVFFSIFAASREKMPGI